MAANPVYCFFATPNSSGPLVLRWLLAVVFFYHGSQKTLGWFGGDGWNHTIALWTSAHGLGLPYLLAATAIAAELLVVLSMLLGLGVRLSALGVLAIMGGAIGLVHQHGGIAGMEYPVAIATIAVSLVFSGAGRFSMDRAIGSQLLSEIG